MVSKMSEWNLFNTSHADNVTCLINKRGNKSVFNDIYGGIPDTVFINFISWLLFITLFAILRNRAWDYGRLALVHTEKWTQLFYKNTDDAVAAVEEHSADVSLIPDQGCLWFPSIFKITKEKIYARCGPDASHYLSFQQQLLLLATCITVFAICVILPVNFQGHLQGDTRNFGHTTITNLEPDSNLLWIHIIACFAFVPLTILIMRKSSGRNSSATNLTSRTLMVTHISKNHRNPEDIKNYFSVRYPDVEIEDVQVAYKIKKLTQLEVQRELAHEARMYCMSNNRIDIAVQRRGCIVCCPWKTQNALEYYTAEEERLINLVAQERTKALENPLGIAFVTVSSEERAYHVVTTFRPGSLRNWSMTKAPFPSDLNWENLEISYRNWYSKAILINFFLFIVLFFLTTPLIFVNIFNNLTTKETLTKVSPLLSEFLPTLILLSMSAVMPVIIAYSDEWMSHWTKSKQNHATMHKTFFFLLLMVLILPSLGLTSAQAFVEWSLQRKDRTVRWKCIFLADKGAFFVNYVITSALIGTGLELLRFPELAMYVWRLLRIKSEAEKPSIRKQILSEFPFGIHYAGTLLIFTISTVYSLTCPLITPFGLLYLCMKHLVDKYNIYYVYRPITMCGEGQQIHSDAVKMVRVAIVLLQLIMVAFSIIRGPINVVSGVALLGFIVTCISFFFLSSFPSCKPVSKSIANLPRTNERYIAPVLLSSQNVSKREERDTVTSSPSSYGSSGTNNIGVTILPEIGSSVA